MSVEAETATRGRRGLTYIVVVSAFGQERDCRKAVKSLGFLCYMPTYRDMVVRRGRKIWQERLLFGRYFFAKWVEDSDAWRHIFNLRQAAGLLMQGRGDDAMPARVRAWEIEAIRAREDRSGHVTNSARNGFQRGQRVRAVVGVMAGVDGVYVASGRGGCDVALLELFGQETRVEFAPGVLQAA